AVRQEVLLGFMDVIEKEGTSFAFPSRTVYLRNGLEASR
ncbi:MAG: mechanosensitive ion channel protein MscS, partial [Acidobacteria bacterium]|nr:mechanosensitive ion channel protein MscS [Acidobacteriota bacterium]